MRAMSTGRAECEPWLALLGHAFTPAADREFARMVTGAPSRSTHEEVPPLAGATIAVDATVLHRYVNRLLETAARAVGAPGRTAIDEEGALSLLEAAIAEQSSTLTRAATSAGLDAGLLSAVAPVAAMPLLRVHHLRWSAHVSPYWARPFCPVCGAWPGLAEVRGLDRTRRFRCLRCASDWYAEWLACPYCENRRHTELGALVSADSPETRKAETCARLEARRAR